MVTVREFRDADWPAVWSMLEPVFRAGETYVFSPDISEQDARRIWIDAPAVTFVAEVDAQLIGTYYLKPNQPGLGAHVANCGYVVSPAARGKGVATTMCEHSQQAAVERGFRGMQFNFVVSTNEQAIRLWKKHGFSVIGVIPEAFRHPTLGFVDACIMHKRLI